MNNFRLPYRLIVQEGIFEHVDEVMAEAFWADYRCFAGGLQ